MLEFQTKVNEFDVPTTFIATQHNAEEFNSTNQELVNAVKAAGLTPEPLVSFASDTRQQLPQSLFIFQGLMLEDNTVSANTIILGTFDTETILPDAADMDNYTFRFLSTTTHTSAIIMTALGISGSLLYENGDLVDGESIISERVYTIRWDQGNSSFVLAGSASLIIEDAKWEPGTTVTGATGGDTAAVDNGIFAINGGLFSANIVVQWTALNGPATLFTIPLPTVGGKNLRYNSPALGLLNSSICELEVAGVTKSVRCRFNSALNVLTVSTIDLQGNSLFPFSTDLVELRINLQFTYKLV